MNRRPSSRRFHMLDEEQTKDAMKVLKRYCATKYRNSVIKSQGDLDNILTPRTPTGNRMSTYSFSRLPTFERDSTILSVCPGLEDYTQDLTLDFRENHNINSLKIDQSTENIGQYIWRISKSVLFYLGHKHVLFFLFLIAFVLLGGLLFMLIEQPVHIQLKNLQSERDNSRIQRFSESIMRQLVIHACSEKLNSSSRSQNSSVCLELISQQLKNYEEIAATEKVNMNEWEWTYVNSVFYTVTLIATIGYGNITCKSLLGKVLTISYGLVGIPLMLTTMNIMGKSLLRVLLDIWLSLKAKTKNWLRRSRKETKSTSELMQHIRLTQNEKECEDEDDDDADIFETFPIWLALLIAAFFIVCCSATFSYSEGWDFFTSVYFTVISFTTVGFGDVVPSNLGHACVLLFFYFPGFCMGSLFIAIIQMLMENHYMLALQLIDQQQELMDQNNDVVLDRPNVLDTEVNLETYGNIHWRTDEPSRESSPFPSHIKRKSSVMISNSGIETPINTPPVLNAFLNGVIHIRKSVGLTRSESILSRNFPRGSIMYPHSPSSCDMFPASNRPVRNFFSPTSELGSQKATTPLGASTGAVLSVISEYSDEDNFHLRMKKKEINSHAIGQRSTSESLDVGRKIDFILEDSDLATLQDASEEDIVLHENLSDTEDTGEECTTL